MTNDEIIWINIIDDSGAIIFSYENYVKGTSEVNHALLSHFIHALQSVGKNLQEDEIKEVDIAKDKFFLIKEKLTSYLFIIKTKPHTQSEIIQLILKKIKNKFLQKFTGHFTIPIQEKIELLKSFKEDVKNIIEGKNHLLDLVESLSKKN
ncbi:MAG: hypothetical protein ACXAC5_14990 [Promethearchaeota archaeon]|jgi:hypothetical protein